MDTCHGKKSCHVSVSGLGQVVLVRTVYSCVPPGVINLLSLGKRSAKSERLTKSILSTFSSYNNLYNNNYNHNYDNNDCGDNHHNFYDNYNHFNSSNNFYEFKSSN